MAEIYRLLCTHCTFGTSELETHSADNAAKVLGYSVRKSSLPDSERGQLRLVFRAVERLLSYSLPRDATAAQKETLSADMAPRRLIFMPNLGGWQVAAQVAYRTHDTAGRPGSYFADLLVSKAPDQRNRDALPAWSAKDILQLWSVGHDRKPRPTPDWWISSEEQLALLDMEPVTGNPDSGTRWKPPAPGRIADIRESRPALLDDAAVYRFLTAQAGDDGTTMDPLVPPRWWNVPVAVRQELVAAVLHAALLGPARGGRETVTLAVEPSVAAVVFYAVCRLLPARISDALSFSTYEPSPDRPLTGLVATTCLDEAANSAYLPTDLTQRAFACDTFRDPANFGRGHAPSEHSYARHVVGMAVANDWQAIDCFLTTLDLDGVTAADLDRLLEIERLVKGYLTGSSPGIDARRSPLETQFLRRRFRAGIEARLETPELWPDDLLRVALVWFGDDFEQIWTESQPIRRLLDRYLPRDTKGLAQMLASSGKGARVPMCVRAAAVIAAVKADPQYLPDAFIDYCKDACRSSASSARTEATELVRTVLSELPDATALQHAECFELTDLILEGLREPPEPTAAILITHLLSESLASSKQSLEKKADLLCRHHTQAEHILRSDGRLQDTLSTVFLGLLDVHTNNVGRHLVKGGRSRIRLLRDWLSPGHHLLDELDTWSRLHAGIERLAVDAPQWRTWPQLKKPDASDTKPVLDLIGRLCPSEADRRIESLERQKVLATGVVAALVTDEKKAETVRAWLAAALDDDASRHGPGRLRGQQRSTLWPWAAAGFLTMVVGGTIGLLAVGSRDEPPSTAGTDEIPRGLVSQPELSANPPMPPSNTQSNTSSEPATPPQPQSLGKSDIGLTLQPVNGDLRVAWNDDTLKKANAVITSIVWKGPKHHTELELDPKAPVIPTTERGFGDYTVSLNVAQHQGPSLSSTSTFTIPEPTLTFTTPRVELNDEGRPVLFVCSDMPLQKDLYTDRITYTLAAVSRDPVVGTAKGTELSFRLPAGVEPKDVAAAEQPSSLRTTFSVIIKTPQGESKPIPISEPAVLPDVQKEMDRFLNRIKHVAGNFPNTFPGEQGPIDLCELPWNLDEQSFDIALATPTFKEGAGLVLEPTHTNAERRWNCVYREKSDAARNSTIGCFQLKRSQDKLRVTLQFVTSAIDPVSVEPQRGFDALRLCRVCVLLNGKFSSTFQLLEPARLGSLTFVCPVPSVRQSARMCDDGWNQLLFKGELRDVAITHQQQAAQGSDGLALAEDRKEGSLNVTLSGDVAAKGLAAIAEMHVTTNNLVLEPFLWADGKGKRLSFPDIKKLEKECAQREEKLDEIRSKIAGEQSKKSPTGPENMKVQAELAKLRASATTTGVSLNEANEKLGRAKQEQALLESIKHGTYRIATWEVTVSVKPPPHGDGATAMRDDLKVKLAYGNKDGTDLVFSPVKNNSAVRNDEPDEAGKQRSDADADTGDRK